MTEAEWLASTTPDELFNSSFCENSRKCRLFACACARRVIRYLKDSRFHEALSASEAFADGTLGREELKAFQNAASKAAADFVGLDAEPEKCAASAVFWACEQRVPAHRRAAGQAQFAVGGRYSSKMAVEAIRQTEFIRDIFGNPFRPVDLNPAWLTSDVLALARCIYEERAFDRMPILADALQDAGCDNEDVLSHCRDEKQTHVRGCWVVDLLLGKS